MDLLAKDLQDKVRELLGQLADENDLELVDVEFVGRHRGAIIRLYVDTDKGVTLQDCSRFSKICSGRFEQDEILDQAYTLEVSSPGIDRPFSGPRMYRRNVGNKIDVVLAEPVGKATFLRGTLNDAGDDGIVLLSDQGEELALKYGEIKRASRTIEF